MRGFGDHPQFSVFEWGFAVTELCDVFCRATISKCSVFRVSVVYCNAALTDFKTDQTFVSLIASGHKGTGSNLSS